MKKSIVILGAGALCIAVSVAAALLRGPEPVPDFVFAPETTAGISKETAQGEPEPTAPTETADEPETTDIAPPHIYAANNPLLNAAIIFDGFDIIIEGSCADEYIKSAFLLEEDKVKARYAGEDYSIVLKNRRCESDYDTLYICSEDYLFSYRVRFTQSGWEPIDTADTAENNLRLAENPVEMPPEGVTEYIAPDGGREKARGVMRQIGEISDKICDNIDDDYDKAFAITEWIAENIYYDHDAAAKGVTAETLSLAHILEEHRTVCGGFSNLFSALCAAQGIETRGISGDAINDDLLSFAETDSGAFHEWNYAIINGEGVWVDAGWCCYNNYIDGKYCDGAFSPEYFDVSNTALSFDHRARTSVVKDYYAAIE